MKVNSHLKPTELFIGHRADTTRRGGLVKQSLMANNFQYISIFETLKFIFCNDKMQSLYLDSDKSTDGEIHDYCDGAHFAGHDLYKKYPSALKIQLYFDDLETTNPLGSKTKTHKMGAVHFSLRNLPPKFNSGLANIHLGLLFSSIPIQCVCLQVTTLHVIHCVAIWKAFLITSSAIFASLIKICYKCFLMKMSLKGKTERITSSMLL